VQNYKHKNVQNKACLGGRGYLVFPWLLSSQQSFKINLFFIGKVLPKIEIKNTNFKNEVTLEVFNHQK
jgi:hypothetical protein